MNIRLTTEAANQLDLMRFSRQPQTGFIIGDRIGTFSIVERLVPAPLDSPSLQRNYPKALEIYGPSLLGIFFIGVEPLKDDWFGEDLVLAADENRLDCFVCEIAADGRRMKPIVCREEKDKHG